MYLSTLQSYDTSIYVPGNIIVSTDVQAVSGIRDIGAGIMGIFGGSSQLMDKKVKDVVQQSMARFVQTAQAKGAVAAIGITTDVNAFVDGEQVYIIAAITGTPLMSKNQPQPVVPIAVPAPTQQMMPEPVAAIPTGQMGGRRRRVAKKGRATRRRR